LVVVVPAALRAVVAVVAVVLAAVLDEVRVVALGAAFVVVLVVVVLVVVARAVVRAGALRAVFVDFVAAFVVARAVAGRAVARGRRISLRSRWPTTSGVPSVAPVTSAPHLTHIASVLPFASVSSPPHSGQGSGSGRSHAANEQVG
jgi:hypothetical protein